MRASSALKVKERPIVEWLKRLGDVLWQRSAKAAAKAASAARSASSRIRGSAKTNKRPFSTNDNFFVQDPSPNAGATPAQTVTDTGDGPPLEPGQRIYAIGDIHGRADLLANLINLIDEDVAGYEGNASIIFLGDYIDRGFQSRQVIDLILGGRLSNYDVYCLKGNHEEAMLQFIADPEFGPRWASYGGRETLVSYGVRPPRNQTRLEDWRDVHAALVSSMPSEHEQFLLKLLPSVRIGRYGFVHAGLRPGVPFDQQTERDLYWIREEFLNDTKPLDVIAVHGHTPVDKPFWDHRRINVDTGAYISGRLTAVRLETNTVAFLSTSI